MSSARVDDDEVAPRLVPVGVASALHKKNGVASSSSTSPLSRDDSVPSGAHSMISTFTPGAWKSLLAFFILSFAYIAGFSSRLFAVIRFESIIHEFDPWFNYRSTHYMVNHGFYNFLNWFDERAWYPLGRIVGGTVYPGLMVTSGTIHWVLTNLHIPVHIRDICVFLAPIFSGLTAIATYFLTKELWTPGAGLMAACFIAIVPGYISRSVAGSYDNEGIAIFALMFTYYLWIKSVKTGELKWATLTALSYFYMVSAWGGYVFIINLIPLHAFVLILMGRFSMRLYVAYSAFFILGLVLSMQIPFVGFQPIRTSEHMAAAGVFGLLQIYGAVVFLTSRLTKSEAKYLLFAVIVLAAGLVVLGITALTWMGVIAPWSGRFYSLWDTGYAKIHIPIIASVSEHQPTTWVSFFFDLHILSCTFPVGAWYCIKHINDERVFIVLYAISAVYFAGVMVRLMLTLTPVVCVLSSIAFSKTLETYLMHDESLEVEKEKGRRKSPSRDDDSDDDEDDYAKSRNSNSKQLYDKAGKLKKVPRAAVATDGRVFRDGSSSSSSSAQPEPERHWISLRDVVIVALVMMLMLFALHCTWVTSNAYSSPSIVLASYNNDGSRHILDDFREAYYWLQMNTPHHSRVMSWWDYGYQIAGMANRTTLVDNNTWNNSHIALVGKAMSSNETAAYEIMRELDVDYVLVIFGGLIGYSGDDINKFLWMVRIAEGEHPKDIHEGDYLTPDGSYRVDSAASQTMLNCLMYKLSYYRFGELQLDFRSPAGYDRTRGVEIGKKDISLTHLEEAYTTEHWLVRIYKVKDLSNRPSEGKSAANNKISSSSSKRGKRATKGKNKEGVIKNRPVVVKGRKKSKAKK